MKMLDDFILQFDRALKTLTGTVQAARPVPQSPVMSEPLTLHQKKISGQLMRVDHAGEVCAQALYQGQACFSQRPEVRAALQKAADEEGDHLAWTQQRLAQLGTHASYLNPFWYGASFVLGLAVGRCRESINLGFLSATEQQVEAHLSEHLQRLPEADHASRAILQQMRVDERAHACTAEHLGGEDLPPGARWLMRKAAKVMTTLAFWF
jgi:ubiquinone biosynthesis monooxygenase Coq7